MEFRVHASSFQLFGLGFGGLGLEFGAYGCGFVGLGFEGLGSGL